MWCYQIKWLFVEPHIWFFKLLNHAFVELYSHRLIKTQIGHARDFTWYRGQRLSPAHVILSHERVQIHARENLCNYATNPPHFRVRELLLCDILITRAGDGRWPRYQAKSLACPGCVYSAEKVIRHFAPCKFCLLATVQTLPIGPTV